MHMETMARRIADKLPLDTLLVLGLAVIAFSTLAYALTSVFLPMGWDHGIIASVGSSYVDGGVPYVDSWDMKGPVAYVPFSLAELLFGKTMWGVRLMDLAYWAVAGGVMFMSLRQLIGWQFAAWAALATYLWLASAGWLFTAAPESWVTASAVIAILPLLAPGTKLTPVKFALCGFLIACGGLVKPSYFTIGTAPLVFLALSGELSWPRRFALAAALAAGALIPPALVGGWFAARGGFEAMIEVHLLYPLSSYVEGDNGMDAVIAGIAAFALKAPIVLTAPFALVGIWGWHADKRLVATLLAWLGVALFCVAIQGKFYVYHWFAAYPPLFILGALGLAHLMERGDQPGLLALVALAGGAIILAATVARPVRDVVRLVQYRVLQDDPQAYYGAYNFRLYNAADQVAAANYIAERTSPEEPVYVWGSDSTVAYLADRPYATRFTFAMPLAEPGDYRDSYRAQAMAQLNANPPTYFVVGMNWTGELPAKDDLPAFPELDAFLKANYTLETTFGTLELYRLKDEPVAYEGRAR